MDCLRTQGVGIGEEGEVQWELLKRDLIFRWWVYGASHMLQSYLDYYLIGEDIAWNVKKEYVINRFINIFSAAHDLRWLIKIKMV